MTIYVFTGPTLPAHEAREELDAVYLPPAAQGDVYRAARERPAAIGIIDGYFEGVPSVAHKEVLWAMSEGVHVFGSASMGALRAAELAAFGMEGVGGIFEAFHRGELLDDDEVAVAHAAAEDGYRPLSEAMVNIRATLRAAEAAGAIDRAFGAAVEGLAKKLFYPDRCYPILFVRAAKARLDLGAVEALQVFVRTGRVNRKREDALAMLRAMRARFAGPVAPKQVGYHFAHTDAWEMIRARAAGLEVDARRGAAVAGPLASAGGGALPGGVAAAAAGAIAGAGGGAPAPSHAVEGGSAGLPAELVEELRVAGALAPAFRGAMARALAVEAATREGRAVRGPALHAVIDEFRRDHGLFDPASFQRWLAEQGVGDLERFFVDEAHVRWSDAMSGAEAVRRLADHLRSTGEYGLLLARARDKARALEGVPTTLARAGATERELFRWYFEERLGRPVPADLEQFARSAGYAGAEGLRTELIRERLYVRGEAPLTN